MNNAFDISSLDWQPVRPNITHDVFGKNLLDGKTKVVLTRVAPGGKFKTHRDNYAHLFYFLSGTGIVHVGEKQFDARAGVVVQIAAGEAHAYENTGAEDLVLISMNIPVEEI
jgi:mannose-6-phosphate isomerase-like protein (cupin superfamily)